MIRRQANILDVLALFWSIISNFPTWAVAKYSLTIVPEAAKFLLMPGGRGCWGRGFAICETKKKKKKKNVAV